MASSVQPSSAAASFIPQPETQCGVYALVYNDEGRLLLVRADNGRCYLPGGRVESGEDARAALAREIAEECGWSAVVEAPLGSARQAIMDGAIELEATYWRTALIGPQGGSGEHELLWVSPAAALDLLHRASDREIVASASESVA